MRRAGILLHGIGGNTVIGFHMRKYVTEFIGTFFFVLIIGASVTGGSAGFIPPLAIGSALMVMIYAGGHISGGHYNPAVTLGAWIRGALDSKDVLPYMASQVAGSALAAGVVTFLRGGKEVAPLTLNAGPAFLAEFLFTFALVYVVLNVATAKDVLGNSYYGLAIGFTVLASAIAVGTISSAAFNPAVAIGLSIMGLSAWSNLWIYFAANFLGGAVGGIVFNYLNEGRLLPNWKQTSAAQ